MIAPKPIAIGLVGHARSGKTTLAEALQALMPDMSVVSFGVAVRERASGLGLDQTDREVLTEVGSRWVNEDPAGACAAVLGQDQSRSGSWLIDGIRHAHIADELARQLEPTPLLLVLLEAPEGVLIDRLIASGLDTVGARSLLSNSTEIEIPVLLRPRADVVLDAMQSTIDNARLLASIICNRDPER